MAYRDKAKQKIGSRKHYDANRKAIIRRAKLFKPIAVKRNKEYIKQYLVSHPCVDCGESDIIVLEFDHIKGIKRFDISNARNMGFSIKSIREEISKCQVRCANCHRRKTYYRRKENNKTNMTLREARAHQTTMIF